MNKLLNLQTLVAHSWAQIGVQHDLTHLEAIELLPSQRESELEFAVCFTTSTEGEADYYCIRAHLDDSRRLQGAEVTEYLPCISTHLGQILADSRSAVDWLKPSFSA